MKQNQVAIGKIWWNADNITEAEQWKKDYLARGAQAVELKPEDDRPIVGVFITLDRNRAFEILGCDVGDEEWLDMSEDDSATCPNCGASTVKDHIANHCVLATLIQVVRDRENLEEADILKLHANCNTDALWELLGPILDKLESGEFSAREDMPLTGTKKEPDSKMDTENNLPEDNDKLQLLRSAVAAKARYWDAMVSLEKALLEGKETTDGQSDRMTQEIENLAAGLDDPEDAFKSIDTGILQSLKAYMCVEKQSESAPHGS